MPVDGGISDSIPLKFMESAGYDKNVVILTQPRDYIKKPSRSDSLVKLFYKKYPQLVKAYSRRPKMYNEQLKHVRKSEAEGNAFVIAPPDILPIGHVTHDPEIMLEAYRIGRNAARERLAELKKFIAD